MQSTIHVSRFWTDFKPDPKDAAKLIPIDKVAYGPVGAVQRSVNVIEVSRLAAVQSGDASSNPAIAMAQARWDQIRPQYEAWKKGQEMPLDGTPLAAWNAVTPEQAEVFKSRGVRTVEQVASLSDAAMEGIPVPFVRELKRNAQRFLDSAEAVRFAQVLADKDRAIDNQQSQITDLTAQVNLLLGKVDQLAELAANKPAPLEADAA